jgi:hypothetical protein
MAVLRFLQSQALWQRNEQGSVVMLVVFSPQGGLKVSEHSENDKGDKGTTEVLVAVIDKMAFDGHSKACITPSVRHTTTTVYFLRQLGFYESCHDRVGYQPEAPSP